MTQTNDSDGALEQLEVRLGRLLTIGSTLSTVMLSAGLAVWLVTGDTTLAYPLVTAGLVILMATPIARVAVSVLGFAWQRQWRYVAMTLLVLLALAGSVLVAVRGR